MQVFHPLLLLKIIYKDHLLNINLSKYLFKDHKSIMKVSLYLII